MKNQVLDIIEELIKNEPYISYRHLERQAYELIADEQEEIDEDFDKEFDEIFAEYLATAK